MDIFPAKLPGEFWDIKSFILSIKYNENLILVAAHFRNMFDVTQLNIQCSLTRMFNTRTWRVIVVNGHFNSE